MKVALVYYQEQEGINTKEVIKSMKGKFEKENWKLFKLFIDNRNEYDNLMEMITDDLKKVDILFIYSKNNIFDDFYWNLLCQSARIESVLIYEYMD